MSNWNKTNPFTLGQVLSVTHGTLLCDIGGVYTIMNHMTGQSLYTHQLVIANAPCKAALLAAFPALSQVDVAHVTKENWREALAELVALHGDSFEVPVLENWNYSDPVESAVEMMGKEKVIVLKC